MSGVYTPITGAGFEIRPTQETYEALTRAYDHFNWVLFGNELPGCLITLQRKGRTYGYFCRDRFARQDGATCDEIALNPAYFAQQGAREVCATLVHEMVHHLQASAGWEPGCPAEVEALAYEAQARWLAIFGQDLTRALAIDPLFLRLLGVCGF